MIIEVPDESVNFIEGLLKIIKSFTLSIVMLQSRSTILSALFSIFYIYQVRMTCSNHVSKKKKNDMFKPLFHPL